MVVLQGQRSPAVRHGIWRELERRFIAADDAQRVDCANDDDEVRHDVSDVVTQRADDEGAELHVDCIVHALALQLLRRRPYARGGNLNLRQKLLRILERLPLQPVEQILRSGSRRTEQAAHANEKGEYGGEQLMLELDRVFGCTVHGFEVGGEEGA